MVLGGFIAYYLKKNKPSLSNSYLEKDLLVTA